MNDGDKAYTLLSCCIFICCGPDEEKLRSVDKPACAQAAVEGHVRCADLGIVSEQRREIPRSQPHAVAKCSTSLDGSLAWAMEK
jgi:hypothetical protein